MEGSPIWEGHLWGTASTESTLHGGFVMGPVPGIQKSKRLYPRTGNCFDHGTYSQVYRERHAGIPLDPGPRSLAAPIEDPWPPKQKIRPEGLIFMAP